MGKTTSISQQQQFTFTVLEALEQIFEEMPSEIVQEWIEDPELLKRVLRSALLPRDTPVGMM